MTEVTHLIDAAAAGDARAAADLLPLIYGELRKLAAVRMASESADHTLNPTALVHEAYLRLVGSGNDQQWQNRGHFFAAAAKSMRRILVDHARNKGRQKRDAGGLRVPLTEIPGRFDRDPHLLLSLHEALTQLAAEDAGAATVADLHLFANLSLTEAASALHLSRATAYRNWSYARAWLQTALEEKSEKNETAGMEREH